MSNSLLSIQVFKDNTLIETIVFNENPVNDVQKQYQGIIRIGKMTTSHIKIEDPDMPRLHSTIENNNGVFSFILMGALKTLHNGNEVKEKIILKEKDAIEINNWKIVFHPLIDVTEVVEKQEDLYEIREVSSTVPGNYGFESSIKPSSELIEPLLMNENVGRRSVDYISNPYFNIEQDDNLHLQKSIGKGIEIKHYWQGKMMQSQLYSKPQVVKVGADVGDDYFVESDFLPNKKSFVISDGASDGSFNVYFLLNNVKYIEGKDEYNLEEILQAHKAATKSDYHGAIRLLFKTKIGFELGDHRFEISSVPIYETPSKFSFASFRDTFNFKFNFVSIGIHLLFLLVFFLTPPENESFTIEKLNEIPERYARIVLDVPKEEKVKKIVEFKQTNENANKTQFKSNSKSDVKFDSNAVNFDTKGLTQTQIKDKRIVKSSGVLGVMGKSGGLGGGGAYGGIQDDDLRLSDSSDISDGSSGGPGIRGGGSGAGGGGTGTLGGGGPSMAGGTGYRGTGGMKVGNIGGTKKKANLIVKSDGGDITGNLTKEQIQKVVNKHLMEIRYCYEKELTRKPDLKGAMTITWKIDPTGEVISAVVSGSTMNDESVESCMVARIKKWKFPEPLGGGFALVKYPFNFHSN